MNEPTDDDAFRVFCRRVAARENGLARANGGRCRSPVLYRYAEGEYYVFRYSPETGWRPEWVGGLQSFDDGRADGAEGGGREGTP